MLSVTGLPPGLIFDPATAIIHGRTSKLGNHRVIITGRNAVGRQTMELTIVVGETIALTPTRFFSKRFRGLVRTRTME